MYPKDNRDTLAQRCLHDDPKRERDFIAVALSGGGTKAAVFSAESIFYLEALGLMDRASVLSGVSGGSFAAALYALSCDEKDQAANAACRDNVHGLHRPVWRHADTLQVMGQGYGPLAWEQGLRWVIPFIGGTISTERFASFIDQRTSALPTLIITGSALQT